MSRHGAFPVMCHEHTGSYARRARALKNRVHHPERGMKALRLQAAQIAGQCPACLSAQPDPKETR